MGLFGGSDKAAKGYQRAKESLQAGKEASVAELRPLADLGFAGYQEIGALLGLGTGADREAAFDRFYTSPGIQFAQDEATRATQRQFAASGMTASGNVLAALQERSQNLASQQFGTYLGQLGAFADPGLQAKQNIASTEYRFGQDYGQLQIGEAQAKASARFDPLGAIGGTLGSIVSGGSGSVLGGLGSIFGIGGQGSGVPGVQGFGGAATGSLQYGIPGLNQGYQNPYEGFLTKGLGV